MAFDRPDPTDDDSLLARYTAGDHGAARTLTQRHAPRIIATGVKMLGDQAEAEDVAQEAFMRLWKTAADWRPGEAKLSTWLHRVTTNLCIDRLRKARSVDLDDVAEPMDDRPNPEAAYGNSQSAKLLRRAVSDLPERQKLAITLRFLDERQNPEVAEILGISVDAVESLLARGKRALMTKLRPQRDAL